MGKKVLLGMSGGVDSSIVALLLREMGYSVIGVTFRLWQYNKTTEDDKLFTSHINELAEKLGIEHYYLDVKGEFKKLVVDKFVDDYLKGLTPFPCVVCNNIIKWKYMASEAARIGCDYIAMGHYAQIVNYSGYFYIARGIDELKDQSFFLWNVQEEFLRKILFPLGKLTKKQVYDIAQKNGFNSLTSKKESVGVCFLGGENYYKFITSQLNEKNIEIRAGNFVDKENRILGRHKGFVAYTIGQHRGLSNELDNKYYVIKILPKENIVVLGKKEELFVKEIRAGNIHFINRFEINNTDIYEIKIRYRNQLSFGRVFLEREQMRIMLNEPVDSVAPGQSVVIYKDNRLLGGGEIL